MQSSPRPPGVAGGISVLYYLLRDAEFLLFRYRWGQPRGHRLRLEKLFQQDPLARLRSCRVMLIESREHQELII